MSINIPFQSIYNNSLVFVYNKFLSAIPCPKDFFVSVDINFFEYI